MEFPTLMGLVGRWFFVMDVSTRVPQGNPFRGSGHVGGFADLIRYILFDLATLNLALPVLL